MSDLEVLDPGILTTVQDLGRPGLGHLGVPVGGAADRWSLRAANVLLGNDPDAAALEVTLGGLRLRAHGATVVAITGADLGARVAGRPVAPGHSVLVSNGETLAFEGGATGARAYVAIAGGVDVPPVLGSRSTLASGRLGGIGGRALAPGDHVRGNQQTLPEMAGRRWPIAVAPPPGAAGGPIAVLFGPDTGRLVEAVAGLFEAHWLVGSASDRIGLRLEGPALPGGEGSAASFGVVPGAIQLPPDGAPIVLLADHQTVGGYPVIGVVASADHPRLGQLRPGDSVRFAATSMQEARRRLKADAAAFERAIDALSADIAWDALHLAAGG